MNFSAEGLFKNQSKWDKRVLIITISQVLALYFIVFSYYKQKLFLIDSGHKFRGVMPECIFVLLGPWE